MASSDAWAGEAATRLATARALIAPTSTSTWNAQRDALVAAWTAMANAYKAANLPPPSDPRYRGIFLDWYGHCVTTPEYSRSYKVGGLVSKGGGRCGGILASIWNVIGKGVIDSDHQICATAVRLSLDSDGGVVSTCLEATGPGDCDYRGLFTGCASSDRNGVYAEHDCNARYDATTFEWQDQPGSPQCRINRCAPPLSISASVLSDLLDAWTGRGGAAGVIEATRVFVGATNIGNAAKAGLVPASYITAAYTAQSEAQTLSVGNNPTRATVVGAFTVIGTVCAATHNPIGAACALVAAAAAAIAAIWPVAVGNPVDQFGVPLAIDTASAAYLPAMIAVPDATGQVPITVPPITGGSSAAFRMPGALGAVSRAGNPVGALAGAAASLPLQSTQQQQYVAPTSSTDKWLMLGFVAALLWDLQRKKVR